jgi:hypothetical protein
MKTIANFTNNVTSCFDTEAVESLVSIILQLPDDPAEGRKGGFFSIYESASMSMVTKSFGDFPKEKAGQYFRNSTEKVTRLVKNPEYHRSFQSRDESKEHWGGGIYYGHLYCAFSGFPEKLDEALSLIYAMYVSHSNYWSCKEFKNAVLHEQENRYSDNEFIKQVVEVFCCNIKLFQKEILNLDPLQMLAREKLENLADYLRSIPVIHCVKICDVDEGGDLLDIHVVPNLISFIEGHDPDSDSAMFCLTIDHKVISFPDTQTKLTDHVFDEHCSGKNYENISDFCKAMIELGEKYQESVPKIPQ